jgi:hypothetical protein
MFLNQASIGSEVAVVAYNKQPTARGSCESFITGLVTKVTAKYIWVRDYRDGSIWKSPRAVN